MTNNDLSSRQRAFRSHVRRTLLHLYHPANLRRCPLLELLGHTGAVDKVFATREVIHKAIQALKPERPATTNPTLRQVYQILTYRYLEQMGQKEVAAELSISLRQLQRLEAIALDTLSAYLLEAYQVRLEDLQITPISDEDEKDPVEPAVSPLSKELEWVKQWGSAETANLREFLQQTLATTAPLLAGQGITVALDLPDATIHITGNLTVLRQAFINTLTALKASLPPCELALRAQTEATQTRLYLAAAGESAPLPPLDHEEERLRLAGELFQIANGAMDIRQNEHAWKEIVITIPSQKSAAVLVVDDNADVLALVNAYLSGSGSSFHGVRDPLKVVETAEMLQPDVIVLDVMLPGVDGWQILGRLKHNPHTAHIPVIISTILPQAELAYSLGADGFLRKPFTQAELLAQLSQLAQSGPESP